MALPVPFPSEYVFPVYFTIISLLWYSFKEYWFGELTWRKPTPHPSRVSTRKGWGWQVVFSGLSVLWVPLVLWCCRLCDKKGIPPLKNWCQLFPNVVLDDWQQNNDAVLNLDVVTVCCQILRSSTIQTFEVRSCWVCTWYTEFWKFQCRSKSEW